MLAVKTEVLRELFADPEWKTKFLDAKTMREVETVLIGYCKAKKLKTKTV